MQTCVLQAVYALPNKHGIFGGKHTKHAWQCRWLQGGQRQSSGSRCSKPTARCRASRTSSLQRFKSGRRDTGTKLPTAVSCKLPPTGCSQSSLQLSWSPRCAEYLFSPFFLLSFNHLRATRAFVLPFLPSFLRLSTYPFICS